MRFQFVFSLFVVTILLFSCGKKKGLFKSGISFEEGNDFVYQVRSATREYEFAININGVERHYVSFDWEMPELDKSGVVFMGDSALNNAMGMHNYMSSGYLELEDKTSVWMSRKAFTELKAGKKVLMDMDGSEEVFHMVGTETYSFGDKEDGVPFDISVIIVKNAKGNQEIWVADDSENPLIVRMELDFKIWLTYYSGD